MFSRKCTLEFLHSSDQIELLCKTAEMKICGMQTCNVL